MALPPPRFVDDGDVTSRRESWLTSGPSALSSECVKPRAKRLRDGDKIRSDPRAWGVSRGMLSSTFEVVRA